MSKASRRNFRTTILGVMAMASLIWVAVDQFDISPEEMAALFLYVGLGALGVIAAAAIAMVSWVGLRKLWRSHRH